MILVTGSTGTFGSHVAKALQKKGLKIKVASFDNLEKMQHKFGDDVLTIKYDLNNPSTFDELLEGVKSIYLVAPSGSHQFAEQIVPLLAKAKEKLVNHIVLTTVMGADANPSSSHYRAEIAVNESSIGFTIIRPNFIFQNFINYDLWAIKKDMIFLPTENGETSYNDIRDVAEAIANVLEKPEEHVGKTYTITGPEALSHSKISEIFSKVLQRNIKNVNPTEVEYKETLLKFGLPQNTVDFLATLYHYIKLNYFKSTTRDLEFLLNRKPTTFHQFVSDYKEAFENKI
ncbi:MAG: NAD-dependent epimerase/dehydratase family protein [Bacteroidetes bacterium]|nr:MAG: NAD-dependent epimerase/dehydratase family protein [Bacteroidota bacterium]TAF94115.1 MAG: NAD-dependent epimerase/dehydratase family protein [Bacteroidota bacterium]